MPFDMWNPAAVAFSSLVAAPSTDVFLTLVSTVLQRVADRGSAWRVTWIVGAGAPSTAGSSIAAVWRLDAVGSSSGGSANDATDQADTAASLIARFRVQTAVGQSAQYVTGPHQVDPTKAGKFRVIMESTAVNAVASINAEPLT